MDKNFRKFRWNFVEISSKFHVSTTNDTKQAGKNSVERFFEKFQRVSVIFRKKFGFLAIYQWFCRFFDLVNAVKASKLCNYVQTLGLKPAQTQNQVWTYIGWPLG